LNAGDIQFVAPTTEGQAVVPRTVGSAPATSRGRPSAPTPLAQFIFWTNGSASSSLPVVLSRT
jgi:hypothetical protein